jgi:phospholipase D1/2
LPFAIIVRPRPDLPPWRALFEVAFQGFQAGAQLDVSFWVIRNRTKDQPDGEKKMLGAVGGTLEKRGGTKQSPLFGLKPDTGPSSKKLGEVPQVGFVLRPEGDADDAFVYALPHDVETRPEGETWEFTVQVASPKLSSPTFAIAWPRYAVPFHGRDPLATYDWHAGNEVKLYNDASEDSEGKAGAFHDILTAIEAAKHFIFVVDWSFHPLVVPTRDKQPTLDDTIGAKLVKQARAGVTVAIHTWNHASLAADDQNNRGRDILHWIAKQNGGSVPDNLFWRGGFREVTTTHHQKFVVLDCAGGTDGRRRVGVFFGGLDLTKGRFDWPEHPIVAFDPDSGDAKLNPKAKPFLMQMDAGGTAYTTDDEAKDTAVQYVDDWYNAELLALHLHQTAKDGDASLLEIPPRQPWHDIHAHLIGPTAWDFVREFIGRWNVRTTWGIPMPGVTPRHDVGDKGGDDTPAVQEVLTKVLADHTKFQQQWEAGKGPFSAQMLRSIVKGHWHEPMKNPSWNPRHEEFDFKLDEGYEHSIQESYLRAITRAERFIYIETQYLIGSGRLWDRPNQTGVANQIPEKIVERILDRAKNKKPFHAYLLIPMYPEGAPQTMAGVAIRRFEWRTMWYMIRAVDREVKAIDKNLSWKQYLSFYFLAQWHRTDGKVSAAADHTGHKDKAVHEAWKKLGDSGQRRTLMSTNRRHMIYIHSKLMIVDDRYLIVGSANLNERSLAGNRDTEDCVAIWPSGPATEEAAVKEIQRLRDRLWTEHLSGDKPGNWAKPWEPSCVDAVHQAGAKNWKGFRTGKREGDGHLVMLPFELGEEGVFTKATVSFPKIAGAEVADGYDNLPDGLKLDSDDWKWDAPSAHLLSISSLPE